MKLRDKLYSLKYNYLDIVSGSTIQLNDIYFKNNRFVALAKTSKGKFKIPFDYIKKLDDIQTFVNYNPDLVDVYNRINNKCYFNIKNKVGMIIYQDYFRL